MAEEKVKVSEETIEATRNLAKMMRGLGKFQDLSPDIQREYIKGYPDENFMPLVNETLKDFGKVDGIDFPANATTTQMIEVIDAKAKEMLAGEKEFNNAKSKALHGLFNPSDAAIPAMRAYIKDEGLKDKDNELKSHADLEVEIKKSGMTTDKQELAQVVDFIDKHGEYFENIAQVQTHIAEQNNDAKAVKKAEAELEARQKANEIEKKRQAETAKVKTTPADNDSMLQLISVLQNSPELLGLLDSVVRMFTGGQGLKDLLPAESFEKLDKNTQESLSQTTGDMYADLKKAYIDAHKPGYKPEDVATRINRMTETIGNLSFVKSEKGAQARADATKEALAEAGKDFDIKNLEKHADIFAKTYLDKTAALEAVTGKPKTAKEPPKDLQVDDIAKRTMERIDQPDVLERFMELNEANRYNVENAEHLPLIFKKGDAVFIGGIIQDSNTFTVRSLETDNAQHILESNYPIHLRNTGKDSPAEAIQSLIKEAKTLEEIRKESQENLKKVEIRDQLEDVKLNLEQENSMKEEVKEALRLARIERVEELVPDTTGNIGIDQEKNPEEYKAAYRAAFRKLLIDRKNASEDMTSHRNTLKGQNLEPSKFDYSDRESKLLLIKDLVQKSGKGMHHSYQDAMDKSGIKEKPMFFKSPYGNKTYAIGYDQAKGHAALIDVTSDLEQLQTAEQKKEFKDNPEKMAELKSLNAIANLYEKHPNALSVAETINAKDNLISSFNSVSPNTADPSRDLDMKNAFEKSRESDNIHTRLAENKVDMGITKDFQTPDIEPDNVIRIESAPDQRRLG